MWSSARDLPPAPHHGLLVSFGRFAEELDLVAEELSQPRDAVMWASALARGRGWILVTGSFRIVGDIRSIIRELEARQRPIPAQ